MICLAPNLRQKYKSKHCKLLHYAVLEQDPDDGDPEQVTPDGGADSAQPHGRLNKYSCGQCYHKIWSSDNMKLNVKWRYKYRK